MLNVEAKDVSTLHWKNMLVRVMHTYDSPVVFENVVTRAGIAIGNHPANFGFAPSPPTSTNLTDPVPRMPVESSEIY